MKARLALPVAAAIASFAAAGCGGSGGSGSDPASLAPPDAPVFIEADLRPEGEVRSNVDALAKSIAGVDNLGELIVSELEDSARDSGEELDYAKEVQPWLGDRAGLFLEEYDGEDFNGYGVAVQSSDPEATREFVDKQAKSGDDQARNDSYQGIEYEVERDDGTTVGVVGNLLAFAEDEQTFRSMVDASNGESLADAVRYTSTVEAATNGSFADVFVDIGALVEQSGDSIDPETKQFFDSAGIDTAEATAVASLVPGSDVIEIDVSTDLGGDNPPSGNVSGLLGSLPSGSVAALASPDFGERFGEALDQIDANGITGEVPPRKFKSTLKKAGIDVEKVAASISDLGVFVEGNSESSLTGAAVLTTKGSKEATNTVANLGLLLRASGTPGVTAISGKVSGFSVRSPDLGPKPIVVAAKGGRIAIAYGLPAATRALSTGSGETLADSPVYKEAVSALGGTSISGFADGPAALKLASALVPPDEEDFREAKPYLTKIDFIAIGAGSSDERATARLIAGIGK